MLFAVRASLVDETVFLMFHVFCFHSSCELGGWDCISRVSYLVLLFFTVRASDKRISCDEEFSDSEDEGEGGRRNRESFKHRKRLKVSENGEKKDADDKGETLRITRDRLHWVPLTTCEKMQKTARYKRVPIVSELLNMAVIILIDIPEDANGTRRPEENCKNLLVTAGCSL